jgi:NAD(P)-dependent dehydrogenase (short-subunit alcohol dehydrogenase family)
MQINFTANFRLIRSMDALLKASDAGRALFLTSSVGHEPRAYWGTYALSKAALEHMAKVYALETANTKIKVNIANPGRMNTMMRKKAYPTEDASTLPDPVSVARQLLPLIAPSCNVSGQLYSVPQGGFIEG